MLAQIREAAQCPVCNQINSRAEFAARDLLYAFPGTFTYSRCSGCDLLYLNPRLSVEQLSEYYPDDYAAHEKLIKKQGRAAQLSNLVDRTVWRLKSFLKGTSLPSHIVNRLNNNSKVLDVGCGSGEFLHRLREQTGSQVLGLDFSQNAIDAARDNYGIKVINGTLTAHPFEPKSFDFITAWWYLEHEPRPREVLERIHLLLHDDGYFSVGIPNYRSLNYLLFKKRWYHLDCPRHLNIWSLSSMKKLLNDCGFEVVGQNFDKTPWGLLGSLQYLIFGNNFDTRHKNKVRSNKFLAIALLPLTYLASMIGLSDIMVLHCQKKASPQALGK